MEIVSELMVEGYSDMPFYNGFLARRVVCTYFLSVVGNWSRVCTVGDLPIVVLCMGLTLDGGGRFCNL